MVSFLSGSRENFIHLPARSAYTLLVLVLPTITHIRFIVWLVIGLLIYFFYGARRERDVRPRA